jgi:hypothetical protein
MSSRFLERMAAGSACCNQTLRTDGLAVPSADPSQLKAEIVSRLDALSDPATTAALLIDGHGPASCP